MQCYLFNPDIIKQNFFKIAGFPSVIAAIDGTHIRIIAPHEHEEQYVNRKHYHSVNVQATCDHRGIYQFAHKNSKHNFSSYLQV